MTDATKPPVTWMGMSHPRYSRGRPEPIRVVVLHATAGSHPGDLNWLMEGGRADAPVSCHYYVSKTGRIVQLVRDEDSAWHCGASSWIVDGRLVEGSVTYAGGTIARMNACSVGVELENRNTGVDPYPDAQIAAAVELTRWLTTAYRIPRHQCVRHLDIAPGRKSDPAGLPWGAFLERVYAPPPATPPVVAGPLSPDSPILGPPSGSAEAAIAYLAARSTHYEPGAVAEIVTGYRRIGGEAGLDWFGALAQVAHETGGLTSWWSARPRRNPAGLGVTGETRRAPAALPPGPDWAYDGQVWRRGLSFARWDGDAIRAHIGRLLAYALPMGQGTPAQQRLIAEALALRPLPAAYRGAAPTWRGLNGRWASPGATYADGIVRHARAMRQGGA